MSDNPPGWYKDPAEPTTQRYWDGDGWLGDPLPIDATPPEGPPPNALPAVPARVGPSLGQPPGQGPPASPASPAAPGQLPPGWPPPPRYPPTAPPAGTFPPGPYPPGPYPPGAYPPGAYPPGAYPPGAYPPGAHLPGGYPPGGFPPGSAPPGALTPGAYPPGGLPGGYPPPGALPPGWTPGSVAYRGGAYVYITAPRPHGLALAPLGRRLVARLIDIAAVAVICAVLLFYVIHQWAAETAPFWHGFWRSMTDAFNGQPATSADTPSMTSRGQYLQLGLLFMIMIIWLVYEVPFVANYGQTLGKRIMGIKVMPLEGTQRLGFGRALRRWNSLGIAVLLWQCGIGFVLQFVDCISPVFNRPLRLAIHDRAAATVVLRLGSEEPKAGTPVLAGTGSARGAGAGPGEDWARPQDLPGDESRDTTTGGSR